MRNPKKEFLKPLKKEIGLNYKELVPGHHYYDPFNCGTKSHIAKAKWFKKYWDKYKVDHEHPYLRGLHYWLVSKGDIKKVPKFGGPNKGKREVYKNTSDDFQDLCWWALFARYLDLVPSGEMEDHKHPDVYDYSRYENFDEQYIEIKLENHFSSWAYPTILIDITTPNWHLPDVNSLWKARKKDKWGGYWDYDYAKSKIRDASQPFHLEIWIEKSSMDHVLKPVCKEKKVALKAFTGQAGLRACFDLLKRVEKSERDCHIFYISDHDLSGKSMPSAVGRKIEYLLRIADFTSLDQKITLEPLALTAKQIEEYDLPRTPKGDKNNAVELDALEALAPGQLEEITSTAIDRYRDDKVEDQIDYYEKQEEEKVEEIEKEIDERKEEIENTKETIDKIAKKYKKKLNELDEVQELKKEMKEELDEELDRTPEQLKNGFKSWIKGRLGMEQKSGSNVMPGTYSKKIEVKTKDEDFEPETNGNLLFDSKRDYLEQLERVKEYKGHYKDDLSKN